MSGDPRPLLMVDDGEHLPQDVVEPRPLAAAQDRTAEVVANLSWGAAASPTGSRLGLPARFALRAAETGDRDGARAIHVAAAAELTERAIEWHRAAAMGEEALGMATLAGDYCLAQASDALTRYASREVEIAFADGLSAAGTVLAMSGEADRATQRLLPACGLAGASAARLPAVAQARWWRAGSRLAGPLTASEREESLSQPLRRLLSAADPVERRLGEALAPDPAAVSAPMATLLSAGGKRIRAGLVLLAGEVGPNYRPSRLLQAASAMELLHAATLCHDDLVDGAASRRGAPTVAALAGPLAALGVGDCYLGKAAGLVARLEDSRISRALARALVEIADGQLRELDRRSVWSGSLVPYIQVAQGKTGALLVACASIGAHLSGASREQHQAVVRFARKLGLAFQGIDDCLDFSDPARTGKPAGTDISQGICGLPLVCALRGPERKSVLGQLTKMDLASPGEAAAIREALVAQVRDSGALATARNLADGWSAEATASLAPIPAGPRGQLEQFADRLALRDS